VAIDRVLASDALLGWRRLRRYWPIRIGITPAIVHDEYLLMMICASIWSGKPGASVELASRNSYRDTIDMVKQDELDFAWVSAYPFVYLQQNFHARLLAMPFSTGAPLSRAYLIVAGGR